MRAGRNAKVVKMYNKFIGFDLGADYCAEHEWGIDKIRYMFNMDSNKIGIDYRTITRVPESLIFESLIYKGLVCYLLVLLPFYSIPKNFKLTSDTLDGLNLTNIHTLKDDGIITAWDDHSFGILVTERYKNEIEELYKAFLNLDIVIGLSDAQLFKNSGLTLYIKSELPKDVVKKCKDKDLDYITLQKAAEKTKIKKILEKAGKKYIALSPRWKDNNKKEVIFWLNPYHQDVDNFGWYTVEDLKDWAKGTGKIPKK